MKRSPHSRTASLVVASLALLLVVSVSTSIVVNVRSQSPCPTLAPGAIPGWPQGATVTVYIDPSYNTDQTNAIKAAFTNWQNSTGPNGNSSGVTFTFTTSQGSGTYPFTALKDNAPVSG